MENTSNYGLKRWDGEDRILHTEFNDNWDKIDTAIKGSADKAAAALAAASALEGKLGLQLIQTVQVPSGSDFAEASISVDWDQWAEIHLLFQPKLTGTTTYSIYFYDTVNKHSASLAENQSGIWGAVLYPMFDKTRSMTGHTWQGSAISATALYQNLGFLCTSVARGSSIAAGTTMTIYGRKKK